MHTSHTSSNYKPKTKKASTFVKVAGLLWLKSNLVDQSGQLLNHCQNYVVRSPGCPVVRAKMAEPLSASELARFKDQIFNPPEQLQALYDSLINAQK
jgi:hypothetical protein